MKMLTIDLYLNCHGALFLHFIHFVDMKKKKKLKTEYIEQSSYKHGICSQKQVWKESKLVDSHTNQPQIN